MRVSLKCVLLIPCPYFVLLVSRYLCEDIPNNEIPLNWFQSNCPLQSLFSKSAVLEEANLYNEQQIETLVLRMHAHGQIWPWHKAHSERNRIIVERHVAHLRLHSITAILNTVSGCS